MNTEFEFIALIDNAIDKCELAKNEASESGKAWLVENSLSTEAQFNKIREQASSHTLPPSKGGGLGITRALSEWAPPYLYEAGEAVEKYYMENW